MLPTCSPLFHAGCSLAGKIRTPRELRLLPFFSFWLGNALGVRQQNRDYAPGHWTTSGRSLLLLLMDDVWNARRSRGRLAVESEELTVDAEFLEEHGWEAHPILDVILPEHRFAGRLNMPGDEIVMTARLPEIGDAVAVTLNPHAARRAILRVLALVLSLRTVLEAAHRSLLQRSCGCRSRDRTRAEPFVDSWVARSIRMRSSSTLAGSSVGSWATS